MDRSSSGQNKPLFHSRLCVIPRLSGVGGMVSFQHKLARGLEALGVDVCYSLDDPPYDGVLVIGGTRQVAGLWQARRKGIPIIQRLNGMNWMHRLSLPGKSRRAGDGSGVGGSKGARARHFLRAEYGNLMLAFIRRRLATHIVYQSQFSRQWWEKVYGLTPVSHSTVHNGVALDTYTPQGPHERPVDRLRILMVEGSLMGGYEVGLEAGVQLAATLAERQPLMTRSIGAPRVELMVVGRVPAELRQYWDARVAGMQAPVLLHWAGLVPQEQIPYLDRSAHLLYSSDVNAACPNSVIEALACGLPVISFDTGALPELVTPESGRIVPYGGNPWQLEAPNVPALVHAAVEMLHDQERFRKGARARAESAFALDKMVEGYLQPFLDAANSLL